MCSFMLDLTGKWMLMDLESICTSSTHRCIRKNYLLAKNGSVELELEFHPCIQFKDLGSRYKRSFLFCQCRIHRLSFCPEGYSPLCGNVLAEIKNFIVCNGIQLGLYRDGVIKKELCNKLCIPSINIECFTDLENTHAHDPRFNIGQYIKMFRRR